MSESFVHLHVHSDYTLSKGSSKVPALVARAAALRMPAMALVDEGNMFGGLEFSKYASGKGVQPIVGTKLWFDIGGKDERGSVLLLARDEQGYANICSILSTSHRPRDGHPGGTGVIPAELLDGNLDGVFCLTGGRDGVLWRLLKDGRQDDAEDMLGWLRHSFSDRLYVEICRFGDENQEEVNLERKLIDLAFDAPPMEARDGTHLAIVPVIGTTEVWYATEDKHDAFEILAAVEGKKGVTVQDDKVIPSTTRRYHMRGAEEMRSLFADVPEAYENAINLPRRCSFMIKGRDPILPPFQTEGGRTEAEELRAQANEGLDLRLEKLRIPQEARGEYRERLDYELGVIERMKFPGYFLIVSDFIKWAKANGIPVGPGRGSGAGSLVAYSLQITDLDPLQFGLLFERFLNPDRVSMPDFDIDFCQDRREEVIHYVVDKYGTDYVSLIATFGEIKSKTALKDVGRVIRSDDFGGYGFGELDGITKLVSMEGQVPKSLKDSYDDPSNPEFRGRIESEPKYRILYENALKVEGLFRNQGSHAAGVIIGGQPLHTLVPVGWDDKAGLSVCQFNMKSSETAGLVKFDFLGLKTLSVIRETVENIKATTGEDIDVSSLPFDDAPTYEMLAEGTTNGVFQFESEGMKRVMRDIKPTRIEDLIAIAALYRPGPMDMIPHYAACKNGVEEPDYPEPVDQTKPFLAETFGIMVYQEQVMQVAQVVAGYSLGGADLLRRAMGKKIPAEMVAQREMFVKGATERGTSAEDAGALFDNIAKFAGYGFNKSHAAAYAVIAYQTAYLKRHYPAQFLAALLTYEDKPEKMAKVKEDMDGFGVEMLPPCVNASFSRFRPERKADGSVHVRFGLAAIKGISGDLAILTEARKKGGPFKDVQDFHVRAGAQFNKAQYEKLAEAGGFDRIAKNRYSAVSILGFLAKGAKKDAGRQDDLFGGTLEVRVPKEVSDVQEWGNIADREFNAVGFYFCTHPLDAYEARFRRSKVKRKASLRRWMQENMRAELKTKHLAGLVERVERKTTKKANKPYIWAVFAEKSDRFDVNFFGETPADVERMRKTLDDARIARRPVIVVGDILLQEGRDDLTIWGRDVWDAEQELAKLRGRITIALAPEAVHLDLTQQREDREAQDRVRKGTMGEEDYAALKADLHGKALLGKIASIKEILSRARADEEQGASDIVVTATVGDQTVEIPVEGKYLVDVALENAIKSTDGVVSFREAV